MKCTQNKSFAVKSTQMQNFEKIRLAGPDCDLLEPAFYKGLVKFCKVRSLCFDEIL